jgi:hypothetical protein
MYYVTLRVGVLWRQPARKLIIIKEIREESRYNIYRKQYYTEKTMLTIYTIFGIMVGFEGYDNGKVYFGVYTPNCEYGYVMTAEEIYLDTIFEKE